MPSNSSVAFESQEANGFVGFKAVKVQRNGKALPRSLDSSRFYSIQTASGTPFQSALHSMLALPGRHLDSSEKHHCASQVKPVGSQLRLPTAA